MSINENLARMLTTMLDKHGFSASLERQTVTGGELGDTAPIWTPIATVKAVWDNPRRLSKGVNDGAPASVVQRHMTIAYRDELKDPSSAVGLRVTVNGVSTNVLSIGEIGSRVGLRLLLDVGTEG